MPIYSFIRNWWYTYPPRSLNCSIWVKSLRAKRAVFGSTEKVRSKTSTALETCL